MSYDLRAIEKACLEHRLPFRRSEDWVEVDIVPHGILVFENIDGGADTYLYFRDLPPAPFHGNLHLMIGTASSVEYTPEKMIQALVSGEILVMSYVRGELRSRSFAHRDGKLDLEYLEPEEEMRVCRIAEPCAAPNGGPSTRSGDSGVRKGPPSVR